ncbi:MAG: hypothetical protein ABIR17_08835 [Pseudolysinimonas sp.]|uniref:hypothetical protein n=1 Tax=Pseudolysinimonas sp. TaxID=2680009 RepID=UPI003267E9BE
MGERIGADRRTTAMAAAMLTIAVVTVGALTGCVPAVADKPTATPTVEQTPAATPTPTPEARAFVMPTRCVDIVSPATLARFTSDGLALLGGPGGKYGGDYFADDTPEERVGGITCVWGDEQRPESTFTISVAPVTTATRSGIVSDLLSQGLVEDQIEGALTYAQIGDEVSSPSVFNVIRSDSWISVLQARGGEDLFQTSTELVDEVTSIVYS